MAGVPGLKSHSFQAAPPPVIISNDDDDLVTVSELFARVDPAPTAITPTAIPAAGTHKRQISEAVPRDERPNRPETTSAAPPQQETSGGSQEAQEADTGAGAANNTRKSSRARKPKRRN